MAADCWFRFRKNDIRPISQEMMMLEASNGICLPRAQSSLELLSQTAIEVESANSSPRQFLDQSSRTSSPSLVTPALSISETLVLPDISSATTHHTITAHSDDDENKANDNSLNKQKGYHHHLQLMPRPSVVDHQGLATMMRSEPSGLCISLLGSPGVSELHHHIYPSLSFSSSCGGGSFQLTEPATTAAAAATTSHHQENTWLRQQLAVKDATITTLQTQVQNLTREIGQLRQLPTGKISQIPLE